MAQQQRTGLKLIKDNPSLWNKVTGALRASAWVRSGNPPIGADKAHVYAAALAGGTVMGDTRRRIALALLWCDADAGQYADTRIDWYREAFSAFPDDERCAFFMAVLAVLDRVPEPDLVDDIFASVLHPDWQDSPLWRETGLRRDEIARGLALRYVAQSDIRSPERLAFVESVFDGLPEGNRDRLEMARYLCRAYRAAGRTDEKALRAYAVLFNEDGGSNEENDAHLAALYLQQERYDAGACAVFGRMVQHALGAGREDEAAYWTVRQAHAFIEIGRFDEGVLDVLRNAARATESGDATGLLYEGAYLYAVGRRRMGALEEDAAFLARLEQAVRQRADEFSALFSQRRWDWGVVVRSLAIAWGHQGRIDEEACALYNRATELCPEDRTLWALRSRALAETRDTSEEAVRVYERARATGQANDAVLLALARAYAAEDPAQQSEDRRREAVALWEDLYRQGIAEPEMTERLALAYTRDDRVNDVALSLWEKAVEAEPKNGLLRLRLGREWKLRGEIETAARWYREAARLLPRDFEAQYEAGLLLKEHYSDYAGAARLLVKAVKLPGGTDHLGAHYALGETLVFLEKRSDAKAIFQRIIDVIDREHMPTLLHLAKLNLQYEAEGVRTAEELYQKARELDPDHPETYRKMADLYHERGQFEEEQAALEKYLSLSDPDPQKYRQLADLYIRRGDFIRAEGALRQIIALGQGDKRLYTLLGEVITQAQSQQAQQDAVDRERPTRGRSRAGSPSVSPAPATEDANEAESVFLGAGGAALAASSPVAPVRPRAASPSRRRIPGSGTGRA